jgi:hypothetical protein
MRGLQKGNQLFWGDVKPCVELVRNCNRNPVAGFLVSLACADRLPSILIASADLSGLRALYKYR